MSSARRRVDCSQSPRAARFNPRETVGMEVNIHDYATDKPADATVVYIVPIIRRNLVSESGERLGHIAAAG